MDSFLAAIACRSADAEPYDVRAVREALADVDTGFELRGTGLTSVPDNLNLSFSRPREVDLAGNRLTSLPEDLLAAGCALKSLSACRNALTALPACISAAHIQKLYLQHNRLTSLPADLPHGLVLLDASSNALAGEVTLAGAPTLQKVRVANNAITALTLGALTEQLASGSGVPMLASVDASANALSEVPGSLLGEASVLTSLRLAGNRLASLPQPLALCPRLLELDLSDNRLSTLPASLDGLVSLRKLLLQRNELTAIPG